MRLGGNSHKPTDLFLTKPRKFGGNIYFRLVCSDCFFDRFKTKFPSPYAQKTEELCFIFNIPKSEVDLVYSMSAKTLENMIRIHGEVEGGIRWDSYCRKQSESNTFEYKSQKLGMSKAEFDKYNKSRAVTKENLITRHGEAYGLAKWDQYITKQARNGCSLDYFIEISGGDVEVGTAKYNEVCFKKAHTYESYIFRYGEEAGTQKWESYVASTGKGYSNISAKVFNMLDDMLGADEGDTMFQPKSAEYCVRRKGTKANFVDYYHKKSKTIIEFFGNYWHANPLMYDADWVHPISKINAEEIWKHDAARISFLVSCGFRVKIIWEDSVSKNINEVLTECVTFIQQP